MSRRRLVRADRVRALPAYALADCPCGRPASVVESRAVGRPICKRCAVNGTASNNR